MTEKPDSTNVPGEPGERASRRRRMGAWFLRVWRRLRAWFPKAWQAIQPGPRILRGVTLGALVMAVFWALFVAADLDIGFGLVPDFLLASLICLLATALFGLAYALAVKIIQVLPRFLTWKGIMAIGGVVGAVALLSPLFLLLVLPFVLVVPVLAGALGAAAWGGFHEATRVKKVLIVAVAVLAGAAFLFEIYFLAIRGSDKHLVERRGDPVAVEPLDAPDPSQPGPYEVLTLTYGSGTDKRRPEFGGEADLTTESVDATPFVKNNEGWEIKLRHWYWGFDFEAFPVNGRVWYPQGDGPFPLVLIVHGNHSMYEYSDPGYAYLGELLASRGFITVSVDENFFNGGLSNENDGRGWMLLQHLKVWRTWNRTDDNPFYGRVDMENIALIGHSRGGESVAIAAAFNRLSHYPEDATIEFDFGFNIRGIIAIAPSDGQYEPADRPTPLENVSYLVLQGGHDADVSAFMGARQLRRVKFTDGDYHFKAGLYAYRANHGQFNTVWGDSDFGWPLGLLLNRRPLLDGDQQRRIAKVTMAAFLEAALHGQRTYVPLFRDHRTVAEWLPDDLYITQFKDSTFQTVSDFEEDVDVVTATLDGAAIEGAHLAVWREQFLDYRKWGSKRNGVVYLGWRTEEAEEEDPAASDTPEEDAAGADAPEEDADPIATYSISLPDGLASEWELTPETLLVFSLADADEKPPEPDDEDEDGDGNAAEEEDEDEDGDEDEDEDEDGDGDGDGDGDDEEEKEPQDLSIELVTADGTSSRLALSELRRIPTVLESRFTKLPTESFAYGKKWEPTLQTFELPLGRFADELPGFDPSTLKTIRFVFDRTPEGVIILDEIGFAEIP
ncbi:MAG: hypothetical protein GY856_22425 [bacterium]|nr:hypothetical protein [bacterium]